jgi:hypothetical protein
MTCPGPLGPEALEAYVNEQLDRRAYEYSQQPHIRALPAVKSALRLIQGEG